MDFADITSGIEYQLYPCAFSGYKHLPKSEEKLYRHIAVAHEESFDRIWGDRDLRRTVGWGWVKSYYIGAIREMERKRIPAHSVSIDRRTMALASLEYNSKQTKSLVCLCCA